MRRSPRLAAALAAGVLLLAALPGRAPAAEGVAVTVKAGDLYFDPKALEVSAGDVTFTVVNDGAIEHNFVVRDARGATVAEIPVIAPGATERVTARLAAGAYRIVCTFPGHAEAGMTGTLTVE
ncbi:MAG TPA: plastocyanin/azurin family copper-binding protein [Thermodesulfobacteriota bacterium]